jgi:hypothetical protein
MKKNNVGEKDRYARIILGLGLVAVGAAGYIGFLRLAAGPLPQALTSLIVAVSGFMIGVSGLTGRCMIYRILGKSTC